MFYFGIFFNSISGKFHKSDQILFWDISKMFIYRPVQTHPPKKHPTFKMLPHSKKSKDVLGLSTFPPHLTKLVLETRKIPKTFQKNVKPFTEWTLYEALVQVPATLIPHTPKNSNEEYPLTLLRPPGISAISSVYPLYQQSTNLLAHSFDEHEGLSGDVLYHNMPNLHVLDKMLDPTKPYSHSIMTSFDHVPGTALKIKSCVITLGRKNGPSNLAEIRYYNQHGELVRTCTEKLFQGTKAACISKMDKMMEILHCKNGLQAKIAASAKNMPMMQHERDMWDCMSLETLMMAKLCCLPDVVFARWMDELCAFAKEANIKEFLFLEVGEADEKQYTCGMMGDVILSKMQNGEYDTLYAEFGPKQQTTNITGVVMMMVFEFYKEAKEAGYNDWSYVADMDAMFTTDDKFSL
jgi:hypothetical protein